MLSKEVFQGPTVQLLTMLQARESRVRDQEALLNMGQGTLVSMTMNIPGPIKTSPILQTVFDQTVQALQDALRGNLIHYETKHLDSGSQAFFFSHEEPWRLKEQLIVFEDRHPIGRLLDLDVIIKDSGELVALSRTQIGSPPRPCFVCQEEAKVCGRSRRHSVAELQKAIETLIMAYLNHQKGEII